MIDKLVLPCQLLLYCELKVSLNQKVYKSDSVTILKVGAYMKAS